MQSIVLSLDDFYAVHPKVRNYNRKKQGLDSVGLKEIDWEEIRRICEDFKNNKPLHTRRYHKYADVVEHNTLDSDDINVLIVEGLYTGYLKKDNLGDISVYLEGNPAQTLAFRKERRKENEDDGFRQEIVEKEYRIICQLKRYADIIIPFEE
jgi:uridine kinase